MSGLLHGIGTGPGDPELLTARAIRLIGEAGHVFYIEADGKPSRALSTVKKHLSATTTLRAIRMPMRHDPSEGAAAYDLAAANIRQLVESGETVAVLCEGDPLLYGSFIHLMERLEHHVDVQITPGIPSFLAAGAAIGKGLARRTEPVSLIPGTIDEDRLIDCLKTTGFAAIMKTGRHLAKVRRALAVAEFNNACVVQEASGSDQMISGLTDHTGDSLPYFSIILAWQEPRS
jgi:precorrin-2/cobalt-factor-2 C20-methyltransferase